MTLTIIKNGTRDFTHVTEFANMTFGYYSMVLNNTLQTVVIKMPNGAQFPNDAIGIVDVFFKIIPILAILNRLRQLNY